MGSCQSKKALKAALKKRRMEKISKGQKASSGDGTTKLPKRQANSQQANSSCSSSATSAIETPTHSPGCPETRNASQGKGKKVLKTSVKETSTRKTFHLKTKCSSNSLQSNSPASLHGRVLQKTSIVSPAPSKTTGVNSQQSLPRFGFKNSSLINSGDSTDSVNSILSDAQTTSDANSNLFDFGEENGNPSTEFTDKLTPIWKSEGTPTLNARSVSPCTISQASSGVTSSLLNGKFKAHTRQLPSPQTVTVKEMNNNKKKPVSPNVSNKLRHASPTLKKKTQTPQSNPAVTSKDHRSKIPQNIKSSLSKTQKASKEIESSNRSINTIDSGLGSSLESDKLRSPKTLTSGENNKLIDTGQGTVNNVGDIHLDLSDEWLKEKHTELSLGSSVIGDSVNGTVSQKPGKIQKDIFKEKRDSNITYGMARQKFAPYSRYRFNYQNTINKAQSQTDKNVSKADILSHSKSNISGVVKSRIAQLEKTPSKTPLNLSSQKTPKKSVTRPTSIEKTPILVNSNTENNIELSRPICKRLEYNEGKKNSLLENASDNKLERKDETPTRVEDLLIVDSVEMKKKSFESDEEDTSPSKVFVNLSESKIKVSSSEISEQKRIKDIVECENTVKRLSDESKLNADVLLPLPFPDNSTKVFSPDGSETSFEVLESGSIDCSPREEGALSASNESYLNHLVAGLAKSSSDSIPLSKYISGDTLLKKSEGYCNNEELTPSPEECASQADTCSVVNEERPDNFGCRSKSVMESSVESSRSESNRNSDNNGDRWTVSGKCTPSIGSTRGDNDQDFLIDDEISDQPGLTFGDDLDASLFGDEDLFSDLSSASATNILSKKERSRHGSIGTTASSFGPDDLMLDYDLEESKPYGSKQSFKSTSKSPNATTKSKNSSQKCQNKKVEISLPGPRYDEEVLSPVACDILSEWSAILSGAQSPIQSSPEPCVSQQTGVVSAVCSSALNSSCSQSQSANVTTHQPLREEISLSPEGCFGGSRSRVFSVGADGPPLEGKKGLNLKPPRQGLSSEHEGGFNIDRTTLHYLCQDVTAMKTLLLRLRRVLQVTDTINPFDANLKTSLYLNLGVNDANEKDDATSVQDVVQQNVDLKRQVVLLQQRLDEKDRTIRSLQHQLTQSMQKSTSSSIATPTTSSSCLVSSYLSCGDDDISNCSSSEKSVSNATTQTERNSHRSSSYALASMSRTSSVEDGLGPTVSFENLTTRSTSENSVVLNENSIDQNEEQDEEEGEVVEVLSSHIKNYPPEIIPAGSPKLSLVSTTTHVTGSLAPS